MTERCTGWTHGGPRRNASSPHDSPPSTHHDDRVLETPNRGFTAINRSTQHVSAFTEPHQPTKSPQPVRPPDSEPLMRHPEPLARDLGIRDDAGATSALDRFVDMTVSPPSSPSDSRVPKRKTLDERYASDRGAKRPKSSNAVASSSNKPRPCASEQTVDGEGPDSSIMLSKTRLSHNTPSRLNTLKCKAQLSRSPVGQQLQSIGPQSISLVAPVTSFDKIQALSGGSVTYNLAATCSDRDLSMVSKIGERTAYGAAKMNKACRAPSTGISLAPILEEQQIVIDAPYDEHDIEIGELHHVSNQIDQIQSMLGESHLSVLGHDIHDAYIEVAAGEAHVDCIESTDSHPAPLHAQDDFPDFDVEDLLREDMRSLDGVSDSRIPRDGNKERRPYSGLPTPQPSSDLPVLLASDDFLNLSDTEINEFTYAISETTAQKILHPSKTEAQPHLPPAISNRFIPPSKSLSVAVQVEEQPHSRRPSLWRKSSPQPPPPLPIVRPPWTKPIPSLSPLLHITPHPTLRTCFRTGEALNIGCASARLTPSLSSDSILLELYARVLASWRPTSTASTVTSEGQLATAVNANAARPKMGRATGTQVFTLTDLWTDGPRVRGEWVGWRGSSVFEADASRLLTGSRGEHAPSSLEVEHLRMARFVGRMRREGGAWVFQILSAWRCGWEDVQFVKAVLGC